MTAVDARVTESLSKLTCAQDSPEDRRDRARRQARQSTNNGGLGIADNTGLCGPKWVASTLKALPRNADTLIKPAAGAAAECARPTLSTYP